MRVACDRNQHPQALSYRYGEKIIKAPLKFLVLIIIRSEMIVVSVTEHCSSSHSTVAAAQEHSRRSDEPLPNEAKTAKG